MLMVSIIVAIALAGSILLGVLFYLNYSKLEELKLKKYMTTEEGFVDLLNFSMMLDHNTILNKNGSLTACFELKTSDNDAVAKEVIENKSAFINMALRGLNAGWTIHIDVARVLAEPYTPREKVFYPEPISQAIDEEQRRKFNGYGALFVSKIILNITYTPPYLAEQKIVDMMYDGEQSKADRTDDILADFRDGIDKIKASLKGAYDNIRQLGSYEEEDVVYSELLEWLHYCVTGESTKIRFPHESTLYLDGVIGGRDFYTGIIPLLGEEFIQVVSIDGFPSVAMPNILNSLSVFPFEYRWNTRFICLSREQSLKEIERYRKRWKQKERGLLTQIFNPHSYSKVDKDAQKMTIDASNAKADVESGLIIQGYYSTGVILRNKDREELEKQSKKVAEQIGLLGFNARIETVNTVEAFLGTIPSHTIENVRRPMLNSLNFADLIPTSQIWAGEKENPCDKYPPHSPPLIEAVTKGRTPFRFNLHVKDIGHTLIVGPTGSGKSMLLSSIASFAMKYPKMRINVFDVGMSMYPFAKAVKGSHQILGGDNEIKFSPIASLLENTHDRAWLADVFFDSILILNNITPTVEIRATIAQVLEDLADRIKDLNEGDPMPNMTDVMFEVQNEDIKAILQDYVTGSSFGSLFDGEYDEFGQSDFRVWDMEELSTQNPRFAIPIMLYLFRRIENELDGRPTLLILDEAWLMLSNETFKNKIEEWLRTLRKSNCAVVMATQSVSEVVKSGLLPVLNESCKTKVFLPNAEAVAPESVDMYLKIGLNIKEIGMISQAIPKREYYYYSSEGKVLFDLDLGEVALALFSSDKDRNALIDKLIAEKGDNWIKTYLKDALMKKAPFNSDGEQWAIQYLEELGVDINEVKNEKTI